METIRVEIKDKRAWKKLRQMEASNLIGLDSEKSTEVKNLNLSARYKNKLSAKTADSLSGIVQEGRDEWESKGTY